MSDAEMIANFLANKEKIILPDNTVVYSKMEKVTSPYKGKHRGINTVPPLFERRQYAFIEKYECNCCNKKLNSKNFLIKSWDTLNMLINTNSLYCMGCSGLGIRYRKVAKMQGYPVAEFLVLLNKIKKGLSNDVMVPNKIIKAYTKTIKYILDNDSTPKSVDFYNNILNLELAKLDAKDKKIDNDYGIIHYPFEF